MKLCQRCGQDENHWRHRKNYQPAGSGYYHDFDPRGVTSTGQSSAHPVHSKALRSHGSERR